MLTTRRAFATGLGFSLAGCAVDHRQPKPPTFPAPGEAEAPPPSRSLFDLIARGDVVAVAAAIRADPTTLGARDEHDRSPLTVALLADQRAVADVLLAHGYRCDLVESAWVGDWERLAELVQADPGGVDALHPLGGTSMHAGVRGRHGSELWRVFAQTASPNPSRPPDIPSPLRAAFELPGLPLVESTAAMLLSNGADASAEEPRGHSSLHAAAARGSATLVEMLIRKGAAPRHRDAEGNRPIDVAAPNDTIAALLGGSLTVHRDHVRFRRAFDVDGNPYEPEPIDDIPRPQQRSFVGLGHGRFDELRARLSAEPRLLHARATTTEIAIEAAAHVGRTDIVEFLLDRGAPLSVPTAVVLGDTDRVKKLLDAHPDRIHERGPHDFAPLWYAAIGSGDVPMARLLVDRGADVEAQHFLGTTALHFAALGNRVELAEFLIDHGAKVDRRGRKFSAAGDTPRQLAIAQGHERMADLLRVRGG